MSYAREQSVYAIDCSAINRVVQDNTPRLSSYRLQELRRRKVLVKVVLQGVLQGFLELIFTEQ